MQDDEFRQAVEKNRDLVFRIAYTYLRDAADADDVTQDVFIKLLRREDDFASDAHQRNWLVRVCVNECRSLFRRPWRRVEDIEGYANTLEMPSREHVELLTSVMRLPEKYRVPLVLHYYAGFSTGEVASMLHVPAATVRTRLARARGRLRNMLEADDISNREMEVVR